MSDERRKVLHEWTLAGYHCRIVEVQPGIVSAEQAMDDDVRGRLWLPKLNPIGWQNEMIQLSSALATSEAAREKAEAERLTLETRVASQRHEIANQNENARRYVLRLDALHFVWCDGPCASGTHRWSDKTITEEVVDEAERNTKRLRTWFDNQKLLAARVSKGEEHGS